MKKYFAILSLLTLLWPQVSFGLMSSTNYIIYADDFNSGVIASSTSFRLEGTAGESPVGETNGASYDILGGYQAMDTSQLSLTIADSSLDLGNLVVTAVNSDSTNLTVFTDFSSGYTLSIGNINWTSALTISDLVGTAVDAGLNEYGFSISGDDVNALLLSRDNVVTAGTTLMSSSSAVTSSSTLTFKASISSGTAVGVRTQTVTLTLSNNL